MEVQVKFDNTKPQVPGWVMCQIVDWMKDGKYGYLQIKTQKGQIVNINKHETVKDNS